MDIHPVRTGTLSLKRRCLSARWRRQSLRSLDALVDRQWTDPLPIYAWLVDHPDGPFVVDSGATVACYGQNHGRLRSRVVPETKWYDVAPDEEIGPQVRRLGFDPEEIRWVVQTHLDPHHADGVHYFRNADVVVSAREWEASSAVVEESWPSWVHRHLLTYSGSFGPFPESEVLADGVVVVATPGPTPGHQSVICYDDECTVFLAGDVTFSQRALFERRVSGTVDDYETAAATLERVGRFVSETPTVYLPSHDPEAPQRLRRRQMAPMGERPPLEPMRV